jgi:hypothetical protein
MLDDDRGMGPEAVRLTQPVEDSARFTLPPAACSPPGREQDRAGQQ